MQKDIENILVNFGSNSGYIEDLYELYKKNPVLVGSDWANFFSGLNFNIKPTSQIIQPEVISELPAPASNGHSAHIEARVYQQDFITEKGVVNNRIDAATGRDAVQERIYRLISAHRNRGHLKAKINPLTKSIPALPITEDIEISHYKFTNEQLDQIYGCAGFAGQSSMRLSDLIYGLNQAYCDSIGFEFMHILSQDERNWLQYKIETRFDDDYSLSSNEKVWLLAKLIEAENFESELHKKYIGHKRFSLQGSETVMPMLHMLIEEAASINVKEIVLGMAHRGRLNVLRHILQKPLEDFFSEFDDRTAASIYGSGDVKYHIGAKGSYVCRDNSKVDLLLCHNPSHLEYVVPVVNGMVRAKQDLYYRNNRKAVLGVLLHGDAAFIGQGVVAETLNQSQVAGFSNSGIVHIVINNQIGFTTSPKEARSSTYCTDFAKAIQAPIMHINCEDLNAACWAIRLAIEFRDRYQRDVVIDLYGWRKYGHNEGDDPSFTQPIEYNEIASKKSVAETFGEKLINDGIISAENLQKMLDDYRLEFESKASQSLSKDLNGNPLKLNEDIPLPSYTVSLETLNKTAQTLVKYPESFTPHPKLFKILEKRVASLKEGIGIDWGFAENLAFGNIVQFGVNVRLTGQDSGRGTFSQRHSLLIDYKTGERYLPFNSLGKESGANFEVYNSTLSENAVLGYEYGYSVMAKEKSLVLWEAQFGDFSNCAQVFFDQFISSGEQKWNQRNSVVMLLPHGYEGQGPEHSSARLERFLQLCAVNNIRVCHPTTAAQYFHLLNRQAFWSLRKPLIVMTPKSLLRADEACSTTNELINGKFNPLLETKVGESINTLVACSGKVYYDILHAIKKANQSCLIIRFEELYPFPKQELRDIVRNYNLEQAIWVQEEPHNMGAWSYIQPQLSKTLELEIEYVGRNASASTAAGSAKHHALETKEFLDNLIKLVNE